MEKRELTCIGCPLGCSITVTLENGEIRGNVVLEIAGIMSDDSSAQVMLHIGIDTVKLEGKGFHALVAQGDHVDAGQPLVEVDFDAVRAAGFDPTVFVIVCERSENSTLREHASGPVAVKEPVVWLSE